MTLNLSWDARLHLITHTDKKVQETTINLFFGRAVEDQDIDNWKKGLESLALAVNHGAFCGDKIPPVESTMIPLEVDRSGNESLRLRFKISGICQGGWRVIANLMLMSTYGSRNPVVEIASKIQKGRPVVKDMEVWDLKYPAIPSRMPFAFYRSEPNPSSYDVLLQIRFVKDLSKEQTEEVLSALLSWSSMLFGGYAEDNSDLLDCTTDSQEVYMIDPRTVEYSAAYTGDESGLDAAALIACWFHENLSPVESMTIE